MIRLIDHKRLQINLFTHKNITYSDYYFRVHDYSHDDEPWYGAFEVQLGRYRATLYIWRWV